MRTITFKTASDGEVILRGCLTGFYHPHLARNTEYTLTVTPNPKGRWHIGTPCCNDGDMELYNKSGNTSMCERFAWIIVGSANFKKGNRFSLAIAKKVTK